MDKNMEEVLCIHDKSELYTNVVSYIEPYGLSFLDTTETDLDLEDKDYCFVERGICEHDQRYMQLIPYVTFVVGKEQLYILQYTRMSKAGNGEERLEGKRSVGFGGHINKDFTMHLDKLREDGETEGLFKKAIIQEAIRELTEEITIKVKGNPVLFHTLEYKVLGLIYDDSNDVGRVHLGIQLVCHLPYEIEDVEVESNELGLRIDPPFEIVDSDIVDLWDKYHNEEEIPYENWSLISLDCFHSSNLGYVSIQDEQEELDSEEEVEEVCKEEPIDEVKEEEKVEESNPSFITKLINRTKNLIGILTRSKAEDAERK